MSRTRDAAATRTALLEAAREQFGRRGYEATTTRSVAAEVGVDAALVVRYFGSKRELFAEAAELILDLPDLSGTAVDDVPWVLVSRFFEVWEDGGTFLPLLRAAVSSEEARASLVGVFSAQVAPELAKVVIDSPAQRSVMVGSQMLGMAFARYVLEVPPLPSMSRDEVTAWLAPVILAYLTGPAPSVRAPSAAR